jgi:class 3 adenylate cyclase
MPRLPSGIVTFLFTDLEGSTRLWEAYPGEMARDLALHDLLIREAVERHQGYVFETAGDAFAAAFPTAGAAFAAAVDAQRALGAAGWTVPGGLRARMSLHTGAAVERDGNYFGPTLNRVARILSAGHGGQVLVSEATCGLLRAEPAQEVEIRDLGLHRLKDLSRPERIYQGSCRGCAPSSHPSVPSTSSAITCRSSSPRSSDGSRRSPR